MRIGKAAEVKVSPFTQIVCVTISVVVSVPLCVFLIIDTVSMLAAYIWVNAIWLIVPLILLVPVVYCISEEGMCDSRV